MQNKEIEEYKEVLYDLINDEDVYNSIKKAVTGTFKYIDKLETDKQKLIEKLEEVCEKVDDEMADFEAIDLKHKILEVLKGEKE